MAVVIGIDEAGYGPNLGPLVVTASAWQVPDDPRRFDFWASLAKDVTSTATKDGRLHIGDSKEVYSPARGIKPLERSVLALLAASGLRPASVHELVQQVTQQQTSLDAEIWFQGNDVALPLACSAEDTSVAIDRLRSAFDQAQIRCLGIRSEVVLTARYNDLVTQFDNKAAALSRTSMSLLRAFWDLTSTEPVLVIADKHGGRNRYDDLLAEIVDGQMIFRLEEGSLISRYKCGHTELRFQQKAEQHFPVAVSSMVCKYTRELAMELFNIFWQEKIPGLQPTKGYPVDAKRFRADIAEKCHELGISDHDLWRCR